MKQKKTIPFDLNLAQRSHKVYTIFGEPVQIVKYDCKGKYPILALIDDGDTTDTAFFDLRGYDMQEKPGLVIEAEPTEKKQPGEPTPFEKDVEDFAADVCGYPFATDKGLKNVATQLLRSARRQLVSDGYIIIRKNVMDAQLAVDPKIRAEVEARMDDAGREFVLVSHLVADKDYHADPDCCKLFRRKDGEALRAYLKSRNDMYNKAYRQTKKGFVIDRPRAEKKHQDVYVPIRIIVENGNEILKQIKLENDIKKHYK